MNLIESLKWRYSVKKYSNRKVNGAAAIKSITEAINLSASSAGLQPYRVIVVEHAGIRQQLAEGGFNPQVTEASHLLVFAAIQDLAVDSGPLFHPHSVFYFHPHSGGIFHPL